MNYRYVLRIIGFLLLAEAAFLIPSLMISLIRGEQASYAILLTMAISVASGVLLMSIRLTNSKIGSKEGFLIVTLGWIVVCAVGALPFQFAGVTGHYVDALFETVSGFTTTGASIIKDVESQPSGIIFWRSLTHWLGGMGILVLTLAVMPALGVGAFQIFRAETPGPIADKVAPKIKDTAMILYTSYLGITLLETALLMLGGVTLFESLIHTFGSVGTGGFSSRNASVAGLGGGYVQWVIGIFMMLSGVNFALYYDLFRGRWRRVLANEELKGYLLIISAATVAIFLNLFFTDHFGIAEAFRHAYFQTSSIITTTGFVTVDFDVWPAFSKLILFLLMFIGACSGSTGGSIKVVRILVVFKLIKREIQKTLHPKAVIPISVNGHTLKPEVVTNIASFTALYAMLFLLASIILTLEGIDIVSATSAVAATLGNIGPGFGLVGPTLTYADFNTASKLLLSAMMLLGRLELFTVLIVFTPSFWKFGEKRRSGSSLVRERQ